MSLNIPTAEEARRQSESIDNDRVQQQLISVGAGIEAAIKKGEKSCWFNGNLMPATQAYLTSKGYQMRYEPGDQRDQRDGPSTIISW